MDKLQLNFKFKKNRPHHESTNIRKYEHTKVLHAPYKTLSQATQKMPHKEKQIPNTNTKYYHKSIASFSYRIKSLSLCLFVFVKRKD